MFAVVRYKWYVPLTYVTSLSPDTKSQVIWMKKAGGHYFNFSVLMKHKLHVGLTFSHV